VNRTLRKTWTLLAVATLAVLGVGFFTFRDLFRDVFVTCKTGFVVEDVDAEGITLAPLDLVPFGDKSGFVVAYDRVVPDKKNYGLSRYEGVRITTTSCNTVAPGDDCACSSVPLRWVEKTFRATPSDVHLYRHAASGDYVVRARTWTMSSEETIAIFRKSAAPVCRFVPARALSRRHVPSLVVLVAFGALAFGAFRARRAIAYASGMSAWKESTLSSDGMLQDESGATIGVLASGGRRVPPGPVIVDPSSLGSGSVYRELPVVARSLVAAGDHARWAEATALRLRDARSLAAISAACAVLGLVGHFLGA
jgi:hypothetical protein